MAGRNHQKLRTKNDLLAAGRRMIDRGVAPSLDDVAVEARISRATVYRYFTGIHELLAELVWEHPNEQATPVLTKSSINTADRIEAVHRHFKSTMARNEVGLRAVVRASLDVKLSDPRLNTGSPRGIQRRVMLSEALKTQVNSLAREDKKKLLCTLNALMSEEACIALMDTCGLSLEEAEQTILWALRKLVHSSVITRDYNIRHRMAKRSSRI